MNINIWGSGREIALSLKLSTHASYKPAIPLLGVSQKRKIAPYVKNVHYCFVFNNKSNRKNPGCPLNMELKYIGIHPYTCITLL